MSKSNNVKTSKWIILQYFKTHAYAKTNIIPNHKFEQEICAFGLRSYGVMHLISTYSRELRRMVNGTPYKFEALGFNVHGDDKPNRLERTWIITSNMP